MSRDERRRRLRHSVAVVTLLIVLQQSDPVVAGPAGARRRTSPGQSGGSGGRRAAGLLSCRCAPDQWEGVLRTVEREFDLTGRHSSSEDGGSEQGAAEMETTTTVHYDFVNGLLVTFDVDSGVKILADYATGLRYIIGPGGCRVAPTRSGMKRMCLPEGATLQGKYWLGREQPIGMWKFTGPNNSTLRTTISSRFCLPVSEETFSVADGYASMTSSFYVNVAVGIRDRVVFDAPLECSRAAAELVGDRTPSPATFNGDTADRAPRP